MNLVIYFFGPGLIWYSPALVRGSLLPFLAHEVGVPDYESINTADDSTLEPKPKKRNQKIKAKVMH